MFGHDDEAVACFEQALDIEPRDSSLWRHKGMALKSLGRTREAKACFRRAHELGDPCS